MMILAQTSGGSIGDIIGWSMLLIGALVLLFVAVLGVKRWMETDELPTASGPGFTLNDLRELHRRGEMSDEEFEKTRENMLAHAKAQTAAMPDPIPSRRGAAGAVDEDAGPNANPSANSADPADKNPPNQA